MFLKSVTMLPVPFEDVSAVILHTPREWLEWLASEARDSGDPFVVSVEVELAGRHISGPVHLDVGEPVSSHHVVRLPLRFRSSDHRRLVPAMEGSLDVAWLGRGRTSLKLGLTYDPPLGPVGGAVDHAVLHGVAEAAAQRFLQAVANELTVRAEAHPGHEPARPVTD
jgi:hypothetical protein